MPEQQDDGLFELFKWKRNGTSFSLSHFYVSHFSAIYDCQRVAQNYIIQQAGQQPCPHRFCIQHLKQAIDTISISNVGCPICEFVLSICFNTLYMQY